MTDDTYNGWANRETWALTLHLMNDQGLYNETLDVARTYLAETRGDDWAELPMESTSGIGLGERVVSYWREVIAELESAGELPEGLAMMRDEVGSWWRVDSAELGESVRESLGNES